jgi:hypothetical protein
MRLPDGLLRRAATGLECSSYDYGWSSAPCEKETLPLKSDAKLPFQDCR